MYVRYQPTLAVLSVYTSHMAILAHSAAKDTAPDLETTTCFPVLCACSYFVRDGLFCCCLFLRVRALNDSRWGGAASVPAGLLSHAMQPCLVRQAHLSGGGGRGPWRRVRWIRECSISCWLTSIFISSSRGAKIFLRIWDSPK